MPPYPRVSPFQPSLPVYWGLERTDWAQKEKTFHVRFDEEITGQKTGIDALTKHGLFCIEVPDYTSAEDQHAIASLVERKIQER